ncbi:C6 finger domain protein [Aspergillus alliaceus]|uniref:C6 finger domain protein n=1 Tax=Petromyces alliaceus TaxID=209559 RepID=A0A5N7CH55_PETAA|nr:C6 finger domain protein [Aspergillus alliaceus]
MPGVPSNKACERCKKRHLKCDETRPKCQRCMNAGVECPGYVQTRKFIDQGASVRRRYAPYQESHSKPHTSRGAESTTGEYLVTLNHNEDQQSVRPSQAHSAIPSPADWRASDSSQPETHSPAQNMSINLTSATARINAVNPMTSQPAAETGPVDIASLEQQRSSSSRSAGHSPLNIHSDTSPHSQVIAYNGFRSRPPSSNAGSGSPTKPSDEFQDIFSELMTGTEHELAFLIRHFSDYLGPWLDISDSTKFFEVYVPIRAINDPFLKYAIAALAAKHLGRMKGVKSPTGGGMFTSPATMEIYPNATQVDWFLKATNYYYLAASRMNSSISEAYTSVSSSAILESPIQIASRWLSLQLQQSNTSSTEESASSTFCRKTENILAASTIMIMCKILDEPAENWQSHLSGVRPLFNSLLQLCSSTSHALHSFPQGARAAFWNFARLDYLGSYINRSSTQFDQENLSLWKAAGISIDDLGNLSLNPEATADATLSHEDRAANSLTWLNTKVINFLAESKKSQWEQLTGHPPSDPPTPSSVPATSTPYPSTSTWIKLCFDFQSWFEGLPETFRPCLRLDHPKDITKLPEMIYLPFPEIFYGLTSCAATMQQYHFGRLALSLNRPPDAVSGLSTAFDRLQGYRELMKETDYRCREICGIALGRPQSAARVYTIPLLFAVGQCFENQEERQIVADLLRGIEADLGWETSCRIQKLQASWDQR